MQEEKGEAPASTGAGVFYIRNFEEDAERVASLLRKYFKDVRLNNERRCVNASFEGRYKSVQ